MSNSYKLDGKQVNRIVTAGAAMRVANIVTATTVVPVIGPVATVSLPLVLGVGVAAYAAGALLDRLFD